MAETLNIALLEPYSGGSHAAFNDSLIKHSEHTFTLATLPARKWKWRMRGAAIWFAQHDTQWMKGSPGKAGGGVDLIFTNDMLSVADLRALLPPELTGVPIVCYFHENQLTYPLPDEDQRDYQYGMTNITSCLASDAICFNSSYHLDAFLDAVDALLRRMPDFVPKGVSETIRSKATVLYPPVEEPGEECDNDTIHDGQGDSEAAEKSAGGPLTILWCHRWEYDKNPEPFFQALLELDRKNLPFELVLLGEQFRTAPAVFGSAWERLRPHIVHAGFIPNRSNYYAQLARCDVVVSTAIQENFGIAVVEAILAGCRPLLPDRLAYPEIIPAQCRDAYLYGDDERLCERLEQLITGTPPPVGVDTKNLVRDIRSRFAAAQAVGRIDAKLSEIAGT